MPDNLLTIKNLEISFNGSEPVIQNVSFELKKGEAIGIIGPNGSGKTSILLSILGILPYKGNITLNTKTEKKENAIGYLPQKLEINKSLSITVRDFLNLNINSKDKKEKEKIIQEMLAFLHSEDLIDKQFIHLSRGQTQRILFIASLLNNPEILLLDEPTTGADPTAEETIYHHIVELKEAKNIGIIFVSHDLSIVHKLADKVLCLNKQMICFGEPNVALNESVLKKLYGENIGIYEHTH